VQRERHVARERDPAAVLRDFIRYAAAQQHAANLP
jgi:hypothetical protein